jgi:hypothetical protein
MDKHGISLQVLSNLSTQQVPADVAPDLVRSSHRARPSGRRPAAGHRRTVFTGTTATTNTTRNEQGRH